MIIKVINFFQNEIIKIRSEKVHRKKKNSSILIDLILLL